MNKVTAIDRPRREWIYLCTPDQLEVGNCPRCGNQNFTWSTFQGKLWCYNCADDVSPLHWGILDGPVMIETCKLFGISFDAMDLLTMHVTPFDSELWPNKIPTRTHQTINSNEY